MKLSQVIQNLSYTIRAETLPYIFESGILFRLIRTLTKLSLRDSMKPRTTHIIYNSEGYQINKIIFDFNYLSVFHKFLKEIDYTDVLFCQKVAKVFSEEICSLFDLVQESLEAKSGYLNSPLTSIFSVFVLKFIYSQYYLQKFNDSVDNFKAIAKQSFKQLMNECSSSELTLTVDL